MNFLTQDYSWRLTYLRSSWFTLLKKYLRDARGTTIIFRLYEDRNVDLSSRGEIETLMYVKKGKKVIPYKQIICLSLMWFQQGWRFYLEYKWVERPEGKWLYEDIFAIAYFFPHEWSLWYVLLVMYWSGVITVNATPFYSFQKLESLACSNVACYECLVNFHYFISWGCHVSIFLSDICERFSVRYHIS